MHVKGVLTANLVYIIPYNYLQNWNVHVIEFPTLHLDIYHTILPTSTYASTTSLCKRSWEPAYNNMHVKGVLTRQLGIYHTIPLPTKLEYTCHRIPYPPSWYISYHTTSTYASTTSLCDRSCKPAYINVHVKCVLTRQLGIYHTIPICHFAP